MAEASHVQELDEETLSRWTKAQLVEWLVSKRQKKSGNKPVLINRILRYNNFEDSESDWESDTEEVEKPDIGKVNSGWRTLTPELCPPLRKEDVDNYFIYHKNPVSGKLQACRRQLKKAEKFADEGFLHDIQYNSLEEDSTYCIIKGKCKPSMKDEVQVGSSKMAKHYELHIFLIKNTGRVESGKCNCKAGLSGLCSHIGGLLLTAVNIKNACTSQSCQWLRPQTPLKLEPTRLRDIQFTTDSSAPVKPYPDVYRAGPCADPDVFYNDIMAGLAVHLPQSVLYQTMNPKVTDVSDIIKKYEPPFRYADSVDLNSNVCQAEFRNFTESLEVDRNDISRIDLATKGQSSNPVWKEVRTNLLTASNFGSICKKRTETNPENLIKKICGYGSAVETKALRYGRKKEAQARRDYAQYHRKKCGQVSVEKKGIVISNICYRQNGKIRQYR